MLTTLEARKHHPTKRSALVMGVVVVLALVLSTALLACLGKGKPTTMQSPLVAAIPTKPPIPTPTLPSVPQVIANVSLPAGIGGRPVDVAVSRRTGYVYVANNQSNDVSVISGTEVITTVTVGEMPKAVAFDDATGYVYVGNYGDDTVSVISGTQVIATVDLPSDVPGDRVGPKAIEANQNNGYLYVASGLGRSVIVISGTEVITVLNTVGSAEALAVEPTSGYVYVVHRGCGAVTVISEMQVIATLEVGESPESIAIDPVTGLVYVSNTYHYSDENITVISATQVITALNLGFPVTEVGTNPDTGYIYAAISDRAAVISGTEVITTLAIGGFSAVDIESDPISAYVYVASYGRYPDSLGTVTVISGTLVVSVLEGCESPLAIGVHPNTGYVYVANSHSDNVTVISGTKIVTTIPSRPSAKAMALNPETGYLYVASWNDAPDPAGRLAVIKGTELVANLKVGETPYDIAVNSVTGYGYVTNIGSDDVTVFSGTEVIASLPVTDVGPVGVNPHTGYVYVGQGIARLAIVRETEIVGEMEIPGLPKEIAFDPVTGYIYVMGSAGVFSSFATLVTAITDTQVLALWQGGDFPMTLAVNPATGHVYVSVGYTGEVAVLQGTMHLTTWLVGEVTLAIAADPVRNLVYMARKDGRVSVARGLELVGTADVGRRCVDVAVDSKTGYAYVVDMDGDEVIVMQGTEVVTRLATGNGPNLVAVHPRTGEAYVAHYYDAHVSIIHTAVDGAKIYLPLIMR